MALQFRACGKCCQFHSELHQFHIWSLVIISQFAYTILIPYVTLYWHTQLNMFSVGISWKLKIFKEGDILLMGCHVFT